MKELGDGWLNAIIEAGKDNIDFLAFAVIAVLTFGSLASGIDFLAALGTGIGLMSGWVIMRYVLLELQSRERLRKLRESAMIEAAKRLQEHGTKAELEDLFGYAERKGGMDAH